MVSVRFLAGVALSLAALGCGNERAGDERAGDDAATAERLFADLDYETNAYVVADVKINDFRKFNEYFGKAPATQQAYGGDIVYRSRQNFVARGGWRPDFLIVERWQSSETFNEWRNSPENKPLKRLKFESASYRRLLAEGAYFSSDRSKRVDNPDPARAVFAFADTANFVDRVESIRAALEPFAAVVWLASRDVETVEGDWTPRALVVVRFYHENETADWLEGESFAELDRRLGDDYSLAMCYGMTPPSDRLLNYFKDTMR